MDDLSVENIKVKWLERLNRGMDNCAGSKGVLGIEEALAMLEHIARSEPVDGDLGPQVRAIEILVKLRGWKAKPTAIQHS